MKTIIVTLIVFTALIFFGCQENMLTEPISSEDFSKVNNSNSVINGLIKLERLMNDPHHVGNSFYSVRGQIEYEHRMLVPLPMLPVSRYYVSLKLSTNAEIRYFCSLNQGFAEEQPAGYLTEISEEYIPLNERFMGLLEKSFTIEGREDGMMLKCRFFVTSRGIELSAVWLALENQSVTATLNN
jgi:hypothetical protein